MLKLSNNNNNDILSIIVCTNIDSNCDECDSVKCLKCKIDFYYNNDSSLCTDTCPVGTYKNDSN